MAKNIFGCDYDSVKNQMHYIDKWGAKGNLFPTKFFERFAGLNNRKVNILAKKNGIEVSKSNLHSKIFYRYESQSSEQMANFIEYLNSFILMGNL